MPKKKILIDASIFDSHPRRGSTALCKEILKKTDAKKIYVSKHRKSFFLFDLLFKNYFVWEHLLLPIYCIIYKPDYIMNINGTSPIFLFKTKRIFMAFDLIFYNKTYNAFNWKYNKKLFFGNLYRKINFKRSINKADIIITCSESTKRKITKKFKPAAKIHVVYPNVKFFNDSEVASTIKKNQLVISTGFAAHKGIECLVETINIIKEKYTDLTIIILGFKEDQKNTFFNLLEGDSISKANIQILCNLSTQDYYKNISNSKIFMFTSLEEGFGIPVIEAMGSKTYVICSDIDVFRELGDSSISFCMPGSSDSFYKKFSEAYDGGYWNNEAILANNYKLSQKFTTTNIKKQLILYNGEINAQ